MWTSTPWSTWSAWATSSNLPRNETPRLMRGVFISGATTSNRWPIGPSVRPLPEIAIQQRRQPRAPGARLDAVGVEDLPAGQHAVLRFHGSIGACRMGQRDDLGRRRSEEHTSELQSRENL